MLLSLLNDVWKFLEVRNDLENFDFLLVFGSHDSKKLIEISKKKKQFSPTYRLSSYLMSNRTHFHYPKERFQMKKQKHHPLINTRLIRRARSLKRKKKKKSPIHVSPRERYRAVTKTRPSLRIPPTKPARTLAATVVARSQLLRSEWGGGRIHGGEYAVEWETFGYETAETVHSDAPTTGVLSVASGRDRVFPTAAAVTFREELRPTRRYRKRPQFLFASARRGRYIYAARGARQHHYKRGSRRRPDPVVRCTYGFLFVFFFFRFSFPNGNEPYSYTVKWLAFLIKIPAWYVLYTPRPFRLYEFKRMSR